MKIVTSFLIFLISCNFLVSQSKSKYDFTDGPYISFSKKKAKVDWIKNGKASRTTLHKNESRFESEGLPSVDLSLLRNYDFKPKYREQYTANKIAAISDIHGQYDLCIDLFKANGIIDETLQWTFGDGHLVVVGDIFDRGPKVTELLWFFVHLEEQAKAAGGKVHILLGNHEILIMHGEMGYLNPKYRYTCGALKKRYNELFNKDTFLGKWLASKFITVTINDILFVHGGISRKFISQDISIKDLDKKYKSKLVKYDQDRILSDTTLTALYMEDGPLWYRGYADTQTFTEEEANYILNSIDRKHIVVGHTSSPHVISLFNNKVLLIDSSIKFGKEGEILLIEGSKFMVGNLSETKKIVN